MGIERGSIAGLSDLRGIDSSPRSPLGGLSEELQVICNFAEAPNVTDLGDDFNVVEDPYPAEDLPRSRSLPTTPTQRHSNIWIDRHPELLRRSRSLPVTPRRSKRKCFTRIDTLSPSRRC